MIEMIVKAKNKNYVKSTKNQPILVYVRILGREAKTFGGHCITEKYDDLLIDPPPPVFNRIVQD